MYPTPSILISHSAEPISTANLHGIIYTTTFWHFGIDMHVTCWGRHLYPSVNDEEDSRGYDVIVFEAGTVVLPSGRRWSHGMHICGGWDLS